MIQTKKCSKCGIEKTIDQFNKQQGGKYGVRGHCSACQEVYRQSWRKTESAKLYERKKALKRYYNLTLEDYDKMLEQQKGVCFICGGVNPDGYRLFVDHDHQTGEIRGLLCRACNTKLAWYEKHEANIKQYLHNPL